MSINEFGNRESDKVRGFKKYIESQVLRDQKAEIAEFTKTEVRRFVNSEWRAINEKFLKGEPGIITLQDKLREAKLYSGISDGKFGIATLAALINYQKVNGLHPDGIAGEKTQKKLGLSLGGEVDIPKPTRRDVAIVEEKPKVEPVIVEDSPSERARMSLGGPKAKIEPQTVVVEGKGDRQDIPVEQVTEKFNPVEKYLREKLSMGETDTIQRDKKGNFIILKTGNIKVNIGSEHDLYIFAERLYNAVNRKKVTAGDLKKLSEEERIKLQENLGFSGESLDGKIGTNTVERYNSPEFELLRKFFSAGEIAAMKKIQSYDFSKFTQRNGMENKGIDIKEGDFVYEDSDYGKIIVFNPQSKKLQIYEQSKETSEYISFLSFQKDFSHTSASVQKSISDNCLKFISAEGKSMPLSGPIDPLDIYKILVKKGLYPRELKEIAELEVYTQGTVSEQFLKKVEKSGITKENIDSFDIPAGSFIFVGEEDKDVVLKIHASEKVITRKDVLEKEIQKGTESSAGKPKFVDTVEKLSKNGNIEKLKKTLKELVQQYPEKSQAIFAPIQDGVYKIHFYDSKFIQNTLTAYDIFKNKDYISVGNKTFRKADNAFIERKSVTDEQPSSIHGWRTTLDRVLNKLEKEPPEGDLLSINGEKLSITQGTQLRDTTAPEKDKFRQDSTFERMFDMYQRIVISRGANDKKISRQLDTFVSYMRSMVIEAKIFSQVREKFGILEQSGQFDIKFPNANLLKHFTAYEIFGDKTHLEDSFGNVYYKNDALEGFYTEDGRRLAIGEKNEEKVDGVKNIVKITQKPLEGITKYIGLNDIDVEGLNNYLKTVNPTKKSRILQYIKETIYSGEKFGQMRSKLTSVVDRESMRIDLKDYSELNFLTAFEFFGDSEFVSTQREGKEVFFMRKDDAFYELPGNKKLEIKTGDIFKTVKREKLPQGLLSPTGLIGPKLGFPKRMKNKDTGTTLCARTARTFAEQFGVHGIPENDAFPTFRTFGDSGRKLGNLKGVVTGGDISKHMTQFSSSVGLIFSDASPRNKQYGHVAVIIYVNKGGTSVPMVFDPYYGPGVWGEPQTLTNYIASRRSNNGASIRGVIALQTGDLKKYL